MAKAVSRKKASKVQQPTQFACVDWEGKIKRLESLLPEGIRAALSPDAARALAIFNNLHLPDVPNTPKLEGNCGEWMYDLVQAIGGTVKDGIRWCREFFVLIPKKNSKALKLDTLVPTTEGFKQIADINIGDMVYGVDGFPTLVIGKSEIFTGRKCYEVEFSTGEKVTCDAEHLWVTDSHRDREKQKTRYCDNRKNPQPRVKTTQEIAETLYVKSGKHIINNHRLLIPEPVEYDAKNLPIPPYALGVWLGDGLASNIQLTLCADDHEEIMAHLRAAGQVCRLSYVIENCAHVSLARNDLSDVTTNMLGKFKSLGVIKNKHIPDIYLTASVEQRLDLLQGLLDTDGYISKEKWPAVNFTTIYPHLADSVKELALSLGMKATIAVSEAWCNGKRCNDAYLVKIYNSRFPLFKLARKLKRQVFGEQKLKQRSKHRQIVSCKEVESTPTQCITVAAKDGQFLITRDYIPTHNTSGGAAIMLTMLLLSNRPNAEFLIVSPSLEISNLAFSQLCGMIEHDEELNILFHIKRHVKTVIFRPTGAFLKVKTCSPTILTGSKPVAILIDEIHVLGELKNADRIMGQIRGGIVSQPEAFILTITTQSERPPTGIFATELKKARGVRDGKLSLPICTMLYEFPKDVDWRDPKTWPMVNPNNGYSVNTARLEEDYIGAVNDGEAEERRWASQHLNIEIGIGLTVDTWIGANFWDRNADTSISVDYIVSTSDLIMIGIDGGGLADLFALTIIGRGAEDGKWRCWTHAWVHPEALKKLAQDAQNRLYDFEADGDLTFVENVGDDFEEVAQICAEIYESGYLGRIGLDRHGIGSIIDALTAQGIPEEYIVEVPQGYRLNGAIKTTERRLADGSFKHHGSRLMQWCVGNSRTEIKGSAVYITKESSKGKVDNLIALFNAAHMLMMSPPSRMNVEEWVA